MKICIPTKTDQGLKSELFAHLGKAPFFTIVDTETGNIELLENRLCQSRTKNEKPHTVQKLREKKVQILVCGNLGQRAFERLSSEGIEVYNSTPHSVEEIVRMFQGGQLPKMDGSHLCHGDHKDRH